MGKREEEEVKHARKPGPLHDSGSSLKASLFHPGHNADDYFMLTLGEAAGDGAMPGRAGFDSPARRTYSDL